MYVDEEDFFDDGDDEGDEEPAGPAAPGLAAIPEGTPATAAEDEGESMDEDNEGQQLLDSSNHRLHRHTDAVVAVGWSRTQVDLVASGSCDDRAFLWRLDKDGAPIPRAVGANT